MAAAAAGSGDGGGEEGAWVPYPQRPEWADVAPLPLAPAEGAPGSGVVEIDYAPRAAELLGYMRAVSALPAGARGGVSRVLQLTRDVIARCNPADYSAWQARWEALLAAGGAGLSEERAFTRDVARRGAKNYQLWNHRRRLAAALMAAAAGDAAARDAAAREELAFAAEALADDAKNYHAWAHRQAVVAAAAAAATSAAAAGGAGEAGDDDDGGSRQQQQQHQQQHQQQPDQQQQQPDQQQQRWWDEELAFAERLTREDVRNNSAWSQRAFVLRHTLARFESHAALLERELAYIAEQLRRAPDNESAWNYLLGLFSLPGAPRGALARCAAARVVVAEALADAPCCAPALDALAAVCEDVAREALAAAAGAAGGGGDGGGGGGEQQQAAAREAVARGVAALDAAAVADPIRTPYWAHRVATLRALLP